MSLRRNWIVAVAGVMMAWSGAMAMGAEVEFTNPVVKDGPDPWVIQYGGQYFYMATNGFNLRVFRSPWLQSMASNRQTVFSPPKGSNYSRQVWAPELHRIDGKWYIYFTADDPAPGDNHRMFVVEGDSQDPQGSYTFKGQITTTENLNAIDGTVLSYKGKNYFIWSGWRYVQPDGTEKKGDQALYIAPMSNPWTVTGERIQIGVPDAKWEYDPIDKRGINEGPEILEHDGEVFLTYSGNGFYTPNYALGALKLTGEDPLLKSSWTKLEQPIFQKSVENNVYAPGHASFVKSPDGTEDWVVYHARNTPARAVRSVRMQKFGWDKDGNPHFDPPVAIDEPIAAPSGVPTVTFIPNMSFERGGKGKLEDFHVVGDVGAVANDGSVFGRIDGGDGLKVGYMGAGVEAKLWQDIGPVTRSAYTLSVGMAVSEDQVEAARQHPAQFVMRLLSVGRHPGGSADESKVMVLGERVIESAQLVAADMSSGKAGGGFRYFTLTADGVDPSQAGNWLRVELATPAGLPKSMESSWQVKLDLMTLKVPGNAKVLAVKE